MSESPARPRRAARRRSARRAARRPRSSGATSPCARARCARRAPAKITVCSPTTSPPRSAREADRCRACARRSRLRARRPRTRRASRPAPRAAASPSAARCPTARRPCAGGASRRSRCRSRRRGAAPPSRPAPASTLTPTLMFGAKTIGIVRANAGERRPCCASESPVVPTTAPIPCRAHAARCASVPSGRVKSISTSAARDRGVDVGRRRSTPVVAAEALAGVAADGGAAGDVERGGERERGIGERRLDQRLAHPAAGAGDGDPRRCHGRGSAPVGAHWRNMSMQSLSHQARWSSHWPRRQVERRRRAVELGGRRRHLVAFPARELVVDEIDGEAAMLDDPPLPLELVDVVPAVVAERARDERRAEDQPHLLLRSARP